LWASGGPQQGFDIRASATGPQRCQPNQSHRWIREQRWPSLFQGFCEFFAGHTGIVERSALGFNGGRHNDSGSRRSRAASRRSISGFQALVRSA
jgi:hypothetical protein